MTQVIDRPSPTVRHPRTLLISVLAAGALVVTCVVTGFLVLRSTNHDRGMVQVRTGVYQGVAWRLYAGTVNGQFCMKLRPSDGQQPFAGACVFDDEPSKDSYYYASGPGPHGSYVDYGPLPANAVAVRIASHQTVRTYRLPTGHYMPTGRFWVDFEPASWPSTTQGKPLHNPQPLDGSGRPVAFEAF